jgi:hypothetical protein
LVRLGFAVVPNFGQPVIQTSEPCGKRSFVRRFVATSVPAIAIPRAVGHAVDTWNFAALAGINAPPPLKAARTILTA